MAATALKSGGSPSEIVFWTSPTGDQIRLRGALHIYSPEKPSSEQSVHNLLGSSFDWEGYRLQQWKDMSDGLRASFVRPEPGSVWPEGKKEDFQEKMEVGGEGEDEALKRLSVFINV